MQDPTPAIVMEKSSGFRSLLGKVLYLAVLVFAGVGAYCLGIATSSPKQEEKKSTSEKRLHIDPKNLDLGEVLDHSVFAWSIHVENRGSSTINVSEIRTSCECLQVTPKSFTLGPGKATDIHLQIDLGIKPGESVDLKKQPRLFRTGIRFLFQDGEERTAESYLIEGKVWDVVQIDRSAQFLGRHSILSQPLVPIRIKLPEAAIPIQKIEATLPNHPEWNAQIAKSDKGERELVLSTNQPLPIGEVKLPIEFAFETSRGPTKRKIEFEGQIVEDIQVFPPSIVLGPGKIGSVQEQTIRLESLSKRSIQVQSIQTENGITTSVEQPVPHQLVVALKQTICQQGQQQSSISIEIIDQDKNVSKIRCPCRSYGQ
jgi:hypothetical protein